MGERRYDVCNIYAVNIEKAQNRRMDKYEEGKHRERDKARERDRKE